MNVVSAFLRLAFGLVFVAASVSKILYPAEFALVVVNYQILPDVLVNALALILPWVELVCGLALVANCCARGAALVLDVLLLVFLGALWFNVMRGLDISCGCFTVRPDSQGGMIQSAVRDTALFAVGLVVLWRSFAEAAAQGAPAAARVSGAVAPGSAPRAPQQAASAADEWGAFRGRASGAPAVPGPDEAAMAGDAAIPLGPEPGVPAHAAPRNGDQAPARETSSDTAPGEAQAEASDDALAPEEDGCRVP